MPEEFKAFELISKKIKERESKYQQTWKRVPVRDLIAVARLKTFRAEAMLDMDDQDKLIDDLVDAAAYIIFTIERGIQQ